MSTVYILWDFLKDYDIEQSYAKEEKLKQEKEEDSSSMLGIIARDGFVNIEPSPAEKTGSSETDESLEDDFESECGNHRYLQ